MEYKWTLQEIIPVPTDKDTIAIIVDANTKLAPDEKKQYTILVDNSHILSNSIDRVSKFLGIPLSTTAEHPKNKVYYRAHNGELKLFIGGVEVYSKPYTKLPLPSLTEILKVYLAKAQQYMKARGL